MIRNLVLREGNLPYAFVSEFDNEAAYRAFPVPGPVTSSVRTRAA